VKSGTRSVEREMKLDGDTSFQVPDLRGVVAAVVQKPVQELRTAYFDTPDLRLWERGVSLRHRTGEKPGRGTWTVKLPEGEGSESDSGPTLDRTEMSWSGAGDVIPPPVLSLLQGIVGAAVLGQVTELVTTRRRHLLRDAEETACAELDDDTVTVIGGPGDGLRFRQLEVELVPGARSVLPAVVDRLLGAGARISAEPKLARALGRPAGPGHSAARKLKHSDPLRSVIEARVADALGRILDHDYLLRADPSDPPPHAIHQARVATRRLRSDLKTFRPALDPVWLDRTRAELKWLGGVLGEVRDRDVLAGHLTELSRHDGNGDRDTDDGGGTQLRAQLTTQRQKALGELSTVLSGQRYLDLLDRLETAVRRLPTAADASEESDVENRAADVLPALVGRQWKVLRRRVRKAGDDPSDDQLHRIRIGAKQLRYAAEMAVPVMGEKARRTANAAENLQTILGEHHDSVAAVLWLHDAAMQATPAAAYRAGRLSVTQQRRQRKLRRQWPSAWGEIDRKKVRGWLR
jgi:CHAD domain-containing protein